ncbi:MAG TPA: ferrous iron transport protein B [Deltaproteobacteria bacterium]|nr:ferrous iron transport protein B [Deltaproteobacteria bacterium]
MDRPTVVFVGNPNTGKSTLFNHLTNANAQVSNYPGTTVGHAVGELSLPHLGPVRCVDVPGTYSLAARSADERVALEAVLGLGDRPLPDVLVVLLDAPRLARSLYLALQLLELQVPIVFALNMMDEAEAAGQVPDADVLADELGAPVVPMVARRGLGADALLQALEQTLRGEHPAPGPPHRFSEPLRQDAEAALAALPAEMRPPGLPGARAVALGLWVLLSLDDDDALADLELDRSLLATIREQARSSGRDLVSEIVGQRYAWIDAHVSALYGGPLRLQHAVQDRIDRVVLHPISGGLLFALVMFVVFQALFTWSAPLVDGIDASFGWLAGLVAPGFEAVAGSLAGPPRTLVETLGDLVVEGLIGGVGAVLVFIPQIALLFLFIALLEGSGYLARAAYLMDRVLRLAGLPGQAFVPLLSGYACAVPAILATRTMPRWRDRLLTMMVLPLTSCSARLPVYTLLVAALFPPKIEGFPLPVQATALFAMYVFSTVVTVLAAVVLGGTVLAERPVPAMLELPPYRVPHLPTVLRSVRGAVSTFVREAGQVILFATVALWALLSFPRHAPEDLLAPEVIAEAVASGADLEALARPLALERSAGGYLGHLIEPVIAPLGYDWKIGVGLIGSFAAREVFVSTMGLVYGISEEVGSDDLSLHEKLRAERRADGSPTYTPLTGISIMVFFALAMQCLSTLAVLRRETAGWRWPAFITVYMFALAWCLSFLIYQGGRALGFE